MQLARLSALVAVAALVGAACQSAPPDETATAEPGNAATAEAAEEPVTTTAATPQNAERPQPEAPRAEGDRLAELLASEDYLLLDVRRPDELEELGTVEGYLNIPIEELADRLDEVPRDRPVLTA